MDTDTTLPRSRRAILGAALGGLAATVVNAVARPPEADAASVGNIAIGGFYPDIQAQTTLANGTTSDYILWVASNADTATGGGGTAIEGYSHHGIGIEGSSATGYGIKGTSSNTAIRGEGGATGVYGSGGTAGVYGYSSGESGVFGSGPIGVQAQGSQTGVDVEGTHLGLRAVGTLGNAIEALTFPATGIAVYGRALGGTGILGVSHPDGAPDVVPIPPKTGVFGYSASDSASRGVFGKTASGQGVRGEATTGAAISGVASSSTGYALKTSGKVSFGKVSGVATIGAGALSAPAIAPGTDITPSSYVLLTPQSDPGTRRFWATLDTTTNKITIRTNATAASSIRIAWLLVL